ncbi:MAG: flagellar hook capping protein [Fimbriimonadia bacterium]|nr:flagellar hook capping protein [Fimbriimonadia bacterium]
MEVNGIQNALGSSEVSGTNRAQMDTYEFLKLLIIELTNQNPLEPLKDRDFMAQMAQINTAQSIENLGDSLTGLQAASLIGRQVEAYNVAGEKISGEVKAVEMSRGRIYLRVDEQLVDFNTVRRIL